MTDTATLTAPAKQAAGKTPSATTSALPKFALDVVNTQVGRVSDILTGAAKAIDELVSTNDAGLPEPVKTFASSASQRLRGLADRATEEDAGKLLQNLQRSAAEHPLATAGIGAAIGTALGIALSRLGRAHT